jgi:starvation-inducible outer membrane lipoprotein
MKPLFLLLAVLITGCATMPNEQQQALMKSCKPAYQNAPRKKNAKENGMRLKYGYLIMPDTKFKPPAAPL